MKMHFKSQSYWYMVYSFEHHAGGSLAVRCDSQELFCFTLIVLGREKLIREHFYP